MKRAHEGDAEAQQPDPKKQRTGKSPIEAHREQKLAEADILIKKHKDAAKSYRHNMQSIIRPEDAVLDKDDQHHKINWDETIVHCIWTRDPLAVPDFTDSKWADCFQFREDVHEDKANVVSVMPPCGGYMDDSYLSMMLPSNMANELNGNNRHMIRCILEYCLLPRPAIRLVQEYATIQVNRDDQFEDGLIFFFMLLFTPTHRNSWRLAEAYYDNDSDMTKKIKMKRVRAYEKCRVALANLTVKYRQTFHDALVSNV